MEELETLWRNVGPPLRNVWSTLDVVGEMRGQWDVAMCLGDVPFSPLVSPVRSAGVARPQDTVVCCAWSVGSLLPNLGVLGKAEYLSLKFTHPWMSALPLQRMKWILTVMGHHGGCLSAVGHPWCARVLADPRQQMEYQRRGKKHVEPSTEAQRKPSPTHSDAHTPHDDSTSGQQNAQASTLTSLVQSMAGNQRSQASPTGDTTAPPKEKATTVSFKQFLWMQPPVFTGDGSPDKAEEWIEVVEHIFEVLEVPRGNKVNYGSYMLKGDAKRWWKSTREIRFAGQQSISWRQFRDLFFSTYFPAHARNKKMQEFLDLQQNHLSLEEYVTKYRHLEAYTTLRPEPTSLYMGCVMDFELCQVDFATWTRQSLWQDTWKKIGLGLRGIITRKLLSTLRVGVCQSSTNILQAGQGLMKGMITEHSGGIGQTAVRPLRGQWPL
ncbi:hypothetical protein EJ110_NYTH56328 [Nymphaea thermarum]|nr:hypothetical protein EJ110_NYTH56328 [Nymphaea thermarum]